MAIIINCFCLYVDYVFYDSITSDNTLAGDGTIGMKYDEYIIGDGENLTIISRKIGANLDEISVELEESSRDVSAIMKSMNEEGLGKMYETLDNIQRIDIDKLNDSIDSLYRIINPLSQIFK